MERKNKEEKDIHGIWLFVESFGYGTDQGIAHFDQKGSEIRGYLEYYEQIEEEEPFRIKQHIYGEIEGDKIYFGGFQYEIIEGNRDIEYNLDKWNGDFEENGTISGVSFDDGGITGIFILYRP